MTKQTQIAKATLILIAVMFAQCLISPSVVAQQDNKPVPLQEGTIQFSTFNNTPWKSIIEYYAQEANLSLKIQDPPPTGTFSYDGTRELSMLDGLDFLNQMLILNDRVLVRNRHLLILYDLTKGIPDEIIETVSPAELDARGKYEILRCEFDISGLSAGELQSQVATMIPGHHRDKMAVIPMANKMVVQETGHNLRWIRRIIDAARSNVGGVLFETVELKHVTLADVLAYANILGIDPNTMSSAEGDLMLASQFGDRILVKGKPERVTMFKDAMMKIDVPATMREGNIEPPYFETYTVSGKAELIHSVLQTMLANLPDVRLDFDESINKIMLLGRRADHERAIEVINKTQGTSQELAVIWLKESKVDDVIDKIRDMIPEPETESEDSLKLVEQSQNRLMALGKPADVSLVRKIVEEIDIPFVSSSSRRPNRFISLDSHEIDQTMQYFETMWPTTGFSNQIRIVTPDQRSMLFNNRRKVFEVSPRSDLIPDTRSDDRNLRSQEPQRQPETERRGNDDLPKTDRSKPNRDGGDLSNYRFRPRHSTRQLAQSVTGIISPTRLVAWTPTQPQENGSAETSSTNHSQEPEDEIQSVPGAPVTIRVTQFGIALDSKDLEALDAIETIIMDNLDRGSSVGPLELFQLRYRDANEAKDMLENYLGQSSGGSGGGGGLGGLMGGALSNMVGGAAGDAVGGLLGGIGGGGGGSGVFESEGDVSIVADAKHFTLLVSASQNDMIVIRDLIDLIDQPNATQNPNIAGQTRVIRILHQDPIEVETMVRQSLGILLRNSEQNGQQPNASNNQQLQMLRALMGGGRGGRGAGAGAGGSEVEAPKASLSVDERNSQLVVTGPDFIYQTIYQFVEQIDVPNTRPMPKMETLPLDGRIDIATLKSIILGLDDPNIQLIENDETTGNNGNGRANRSSSGGRTNNNSNPAAGAAEAARAAAIRQMLQGANRGGANRGGGFNRGGANRGGNRGGGDRNRGGNRDNR